MLHDFGDPSRARQAPEVEHLNHSDFVEEALGALRVARSAIQMLALAISQHEEILRKQTDGIIGILIAHDHHWIRGEDEDGAPTTYTRAGERFNSGRVVY